MASTMYRNDWNWDSLSSRDWDAVNRSSRSISRATTRTGVGQSQNSLSVHRTTSGRTERDLNGCDTDQLSWRSRTPEPVVTRREFRVLRRDQEPVQPEIERRLVKIIREESSAPEPEPIRKEFRVIREREQETQPDLREVRIIRESEPKPETREFRIVRERELEPEPEPREVRIVKERTQEVEPATRELRIIRDPPRLAPATDTLRLSRSVGQLRMLEAPPPIVIRQEPQQIVIRRAPTPPATIQAPPIERSMVKSFRKTKITKDRLTRSRSRSAEETGSFRFSKRSARATSRRRRNDEYDSEGYTSRSDRGRSLSSSPRRGFASTLKAAALGAIGAKVATRSKSKRSKRSRSISRSSSRGRDRGVRRSHSSGPKTRDRSKPRSRSKSRARQILVLGLGAAAVGATAAAYARKQRKARMEDSKSRSRTRRQSVGDSESRFYRESSRGYNGENSLDSSSSEDGKKQRKYKQRSSSRRLSGRQSSGRSRDRQTPSEDMAADRGVMAASTYANRKNEEQEDIGGNATNQDPYNRQPYSPYSPRPDYTPEGASYQYRPPTFPHAASYSPYNPQVQPTASTPPKLQHSFSYPPMNGNAPSTLNAGATFHPQAVEGQFGADENVSVGKSLDNSVAQLPHSF